MHKYTQFECTLTLFQLPHCTYEIGIVDDDKVSKIVPSKLRQPQNIHS